MAKEVKEGQDEVFLLERRVKMSGSLHLRQKDALR